MQHVWLDLKISSDQRPNSESLKLIFSPQKVNCLLWSAQNGFLFEKPNLKKKHILSWKNIRIHACLELGVWSNEQDLDWQVPGRETY